MSEERIQDLETTVAYQEQALKDLNAALLEQEKEMQNLKSKISFLETQISEERLVKPIEEEDEKPPHY